MNKVPVKIKRLHPDAVIPKYATDLSAGFDLYAVEDVIIEPGETKAVGLGLAFEIPAGYEIQIRPRSGISLKTLLRQSNSVGTIDADYRGEVKVMFDNIAEPDYRLYIDDLRSEVYAVNGEVFDIKGEVSMEVDYGSLLHGSYIIRKGDRICQGILSKVPQANFIEVEELSDTERGCGGLGSTGVR